MPEPMTLLEENRKLKACLVDVVRYISGISKPPLAHILLKHGVMDDADQPTDLLRERAASPAQPKIEEAAHEPFELDYGAASPASERAGKLTCLDCPAPYGEDGWCDVVIPNEVWNALCPEGGVLCFRCMTKRLEARGYSCINPVPVIVASGPYRDANEEWRLTGIEHGRKIEREAMERAGEPQGDGLRTPKGFRRVEAWTDGKELIVCEWPEEDDEAHDCDALGCSTLNHVKYRVAIPDWQAAQKQPAPPTGGSDA